MIETLDSIDDPRLSPSKKGDKDIKSFNRNGENVQNKWSNICTYPLYFPGMDWLNVAIAARIFLYRFTRE